MLRPRNPPRPEPLQWLTSAFIFNRIESYPQNRIGNSKAGDSDRNGIHFVESALEHLRRGIPPNRDSHQAPPLHRQKNDLVEWAENLGLLLTIDQLPETAVRGGQEHDIFHDLGSDRYFKVTRSGIFGMCPGVELSMVSLSPDARCFHLWEATPLEYLERLFLHNLLVPDLNALEGIIHQADGDLAIATSQPRFDLCEVGQEEIDLWFQSQGFRKITDAGFYRAADNVAVFDAHEKNVVRAGGTLVPFDIIPCQPGGGFLEFIEETLDRGESLQAIRKITTPR
jgi:hypothetical protein